MDKGPSSQSYGFSNSHSCMDVRVGLWRKLSTKELMFFNCGVREDSWESLGLQGYQTSRRSVLNIHWKDWCSIWNSNTSPPDVKNWLIRKDLDAWKDWRQEEKQMTQYEAVGWHHRLNGHEFEQAPGAGDGQRSLVCYSPWGRQESDLTEWLNWTANHITFAKILPHSQSCRSHSINTQSPDHIWWVKGIFGNSSIFYPCFLAWHIELSIHDYPFQISIALLQPDLVFLC